jgi:hypothetical protein
MLKWWRVGEPEPQGLYIAMIKSYDIDKTMVAAIENARPGMVAIVFSKFCGARAIELCEEAAAKRRLTNPEFRRIIWWYGPHDASQFREDSPIRKIKWIR